MSSRDWDPFVWERANALLRQAERIQRNFIQIALTSQYRASQGRTSSWEPPVNIVETDDVLGSDLLDGLLVERGYVGCLHGHVYSCGGRARQPSCGVGTSSNNIHAGERNKS